jgi:hypothetical protein
MQKHAEKVRVCDKDDHLSDGYHVFVALIGIVVAMTCVIVLLFGIEMLT